MITPRSKTSIPPRPRERAELARYVCLLIVYYAEVSQDSDGPVEVMIAD